MTQKDCKSCKNMTVGKDHTTDEYNLSDQFPIGMRVLAVDDNSTCLMLLETVLRKCQYNVTTAKSAVAALELLRQSKNKFDLVISDVHMPDMDGFKLLEVLGLEMDLPVIMLSVNDDPKMVLKGITHGACDYLLKPVRMEELGNIWQHVIRKKRSNKTSNQDKPNSDSCNERSASTGTSDQNGKSSKKRKDKDEEDDEEHESFHDNEESTQKKRRIVWNPQLHCKFVAAVNQLGVDKAVPKKILDLMNEEKLTRENVASHLQKYRLYLKKISQQGNLMVAVGSADTSYLRMGSLNGHLPTPSGPQHFCNNVLRSYPLDGITMPLSGTLRQGTIPPTDNLSFANLQGGNLSAASSITSLSSQSHDLLTDMHSQGVTFTNNPGQLSNNVPFQGWDYHNQSGSYHSHVIGNSLISVNGDVDPEGYSSMNSTFNRNLELSFCDPLQMKHDGGMRLNEQTSSKLQEGYIMNQHKSHNSCVTNKNLGSLEDLVSAMINRNKTR